VPEQGLSGRLGELERKYWSNGADPKPPTEIPWLGPVRTDLKSRVSNVARGANLTPTLSGFSFKFAATDRGRPGR
jgi:hypothetical protein